MIDFEELLAFELSVLRDYLKAGHPPLDPQKHRRALLAFFDETKHVCVRRGGGLVAYVSVRPQEAGCWFVRGLAIHPEHKNSAVVRGLLHQFRDLVAHNEISVLRSNVFKANTASVRLHKRLGFKVSRENELGYEFTLSDLSYFAA